MNIPIWLIAIGVPSIFILGFLVCAALTTSKVQDLFDRIDRALECETANAAHGVKKMARILRGERL